MKSFLNVQDLGNLQQALKEAAEVKNDRYQWQHLGKNKTLLMVFFNNSLRTRLSTQKAAMNLGMNVIVLDVNAGAWKLETEHGVIMDGDKSEHLLEAIPVMGSYCDLIGIRSFAGLTDRDYDYAETVYHQFLKYSGRPVFAMETATVHPLQAFADLITIQEYWKQNPLHTSRRHEERGESLKMVLLDWSVNCCCNLQTSPDTIPIHCHSYHIFLIRLPVLSLHHVFANCYYRCTKQHCLYYCYRCIYSLWFCFLLSPHIPILPLLGDGSSCLLVHLVL